MHISTLLKILTLCCCLSLPLLAHASGNISPADKYSWSENSGWVNLASTNGGTAVYDDHLEGFAWSENVGWIKLGSHVGGGYFTYGNNTNANWGVNLSGANLSGYAWSETAGWINFAPSGGGVSINPASGVFDGYAWGENSGWLHFKGTSPAYGVTFVPSRQVSGIAVNAADRLKITSTVDGSGVHLSSDGGANWSAALPQPTDRRLKKTVVHPASATTMFTATHGSGVFKSTDSGATWSACGNNGLNLNLYSLAIDSSGILYAGTKGGIFSSADCTEWRAKNTNLPNNGGLYSQSELAVDPETSSILYAGLSGSGIYKSTDSGANWTAATTQPGNSAITTLAIKTGDSTTLYVGTYGGGVFTSTDSGNIWAACTNTNLTNLNVISFSAASGKLYAGTAAGVFVSADGCGSWTEMNSGLPN